MPQYLVLYRADVSADDQMQQSEEAAQADMQAWTDWADSVGPAVVDLGTPLVAVRSVSADGVSVASATVAGYSIVEAPSADAAAALFSNHPHLNIGTVEVYETLEVPGA
jgi:hypothetical protein